MAFLTRIPTLYLILALIAGLSVTHYLAYNKGVKAEQKEHAKALAEQLKKEREYLDAIDVLSREIVKKYAVVEAKDRIVYRTIIKEIKNATTNSPCLNDTAVGLWNNALVGTMPETPTGTVAETSGTSATDTEILENAAENFQLHKECRNRLNALIDWHENVDKTEVK